MRILLVTTRFPLPPWRGQQVRTIEWIRALTDHEIVLVCPKPTDDFGRHEEALSGVSVYQHRSGAIRRVVSLGFGAVGGRPLQEALYRTPAAIAAVREALRAEVPDLVVVQMVRCAWVHEIVASEAPGVPVLFDAIDAMALHYARAADGRAWPMSAMYAAESDRCRRIEEHLASTARLVSAVSGRDLEAIGVAEDRGRVIPVSGKASEVDRNPSRQPVVLLSGNLGYRPTVEACSWVSREVWPAIRARYPSARWIIAGARPHRRVLALDSIEGIEVHGDAPSLDPFRARAWVALSPMASGSGVPMKVLEAWAGGVPVVARGWAADGLEEGARSAVVVADDADAFAAAVNGLLDSNERRAQLAEVGKNAWRRFYHPDVVAEKIRAAISACAG